MHDLCLVCNLRLSFIAGPFLDNSMGHYSYELFKFFYPPVSNAKTAGEIKLVILFSARLDLASVFIYNRGTHTPHNEASRRPQ